MALVITVPSGQLGLAMFAASNNPVYGNRSQSFSYHLQTNEGVHRGPLVGVTGGSLDWHANAQVKGGGKITVQQNSRGDHNWLKLRIKIVMHIEGVGDYPLGVYIPSAPKEAWDDTNLTLDIELLDKCSVLSQDFVAESYSLAAGTNVTTAVRDLIASSGERAGSITEGEDTLHRAMTWEGGTSKLSIINDLLDAANYFSLTVDGDGHFVVEKYRAPKGRPVRHEFLDNYKSVYLPVFNFDKDIYSVPNKVIAVGRGSGEEEAWTAVATNQNPKSPYSYQQRGRWIVDVQKGIEATSQATLQAYAERRLSQLSSPQGVLTISHAPLPWLGLNDCVRFRRGMADLDMKAVVTNVRIDLDPLALMQTGLMEVVDL